MGRVVELRVIPGCDFCAKQGKTIPAVVDCKTVMGGWGYACEECRKRWSEGGRFPPGEYELENPLVLEGSLTKPTMSDKDRAAFAKKAMANPPMDHIQSMMMDEEPWEATDGCLTDPDGKCEHGYPSWGIALGFF